MADLAELEALLPQDAMSSESDIELTSEKDRPARPVLARSRVGGPYRVLAGLLLIVALALGLGLGLGLGLKHDKHDSTSSTSDGSTSSNSSDPSLLPLATSALNNFVLDGLTGQAPQTRTYHFEISQVEGAPDGVSKPMLVVNGIYPGPTIEANQGDRIVVNVTNTLQDRTTIHWHGLFQNQTNFYDGTASITECGIPSGQSLVYNFTFGEFSGTTWYHAHETQYTDGITGALIVHPSTSPPSGFPVWDGELVVQMSDLYHKFSTDLLSQYLSPWGIDGTPGDEPVPDGGTLNGLGQWNNGGDYFNFTLQPNQTYLIRLINSGSFASMRFSVDYHPLTVVEVEGTLVEPYTVSGLTLAVAQRYSVLLHTNETAGDGRYWMRTTLQSDMFTYNQPGQNLDIRGVIRYGGSPDNNSLPTATDDPGVPGAKLGDMDTSLLVPAVVDKPPARTRMYTVKVTLQKTVDSRFLAFMNTTSWEPLQGTTTLLRAQAAFQNGGVYGAEGGSLQAGEQFMITEDSIQVVDLLINNLDDGDHPFHLHGHRPWVMGTGVGRYVGQKLDDTNPLRRDTVLIPAYSWMILRFVTDNPGMWAFHCHLSWHMAAGLLMQINSLPTMAAQLPIPQAIISQCQA